MEISQTAVAPVREVTSLALIESMGVNQIATTMQKINSFQQIVQENLKEGHDYGIIPGCGKKPSLLKPGAEKILMLFGVTSEYELVERVQDYEKGFFAYTVCCQLSKGGNLITEGVGHCNSKESRYKNQDPYTVANTCLKMAKKRSQVDAVLTIASLSQIFTQDIEDGVVEADSISSFNSDGGGADITLTFGKHKGKRLSEVPRDYLKWFQENARDANLRRAVEAFLNGATDGAYSNETHEHQDEPDYSDFDIDSLVDSQPA